MELPDRQGKKEGGQMIMFIVSLCLIGLVWQQYQLDKLETRYDEMYRLESEMRDRVRTLTVSNYELKAKVQSHTARLSTHAKTHMILRTRIVALQRGVKNEQP